MNFIIAIAFLPSSLSVFVCFNSASRVVLQPERARGAHCPLVRAKMNKNAVGRIHPESDRRRRRRHRRRDRHDDASRIHEIWTAVKRGNKVLWRRPPLAPLVNCITFNPAAVILPFHSSGVNNIAKITNICNVRIILQYDIISQVLGRRTFYQSFDSYCCKLSYNLAEACLHSIYFFRN